MASVLNISAYKFAPLSDLPVLRAQVMALAQAHGLKGTVLLSAEGINLFLAGEAAAVRALVATLCQRPELADLAPKESWSDAQPFERLRVKIKREIITFGVSGIDPARSPARSVTPETLKQWLDEGRPITLLDTRNAYEVAEGSFRGAVALNIDTFRQFPAAVERLPEELRRNPVVAFCTGGIRCEKAAPFLEREGWSDVYQLEGGILKYFERCGGAHFEGKCFVFDERTTLDPQLRPSREE